MYLKMYEKKFKICFICLLHWYVYMNYCRCMYLLVTFQKQFQNEQTFNMNSILYVLKPLINIIYLIFHIFMGYADIAIYCNYNYYIMYNANNTLMSIGRCKYCSRYNIIKYHTRQYDTYTNYKHNILHQRQDIPINKKYIYKTE